MKPFVATTLLLGYILLVPFCFFGGMLMFGTTAMNMDGLAAHQMSDCGMPIGGCALPVHAGGMDAAAHHVGMYNSITQTPLTALALLVVTMTAVLLIAFVLSGNALRSPIAEIVAYGRTRKRKTQYNATTHLRHWLSLFESSPNFA